MSDESKTYVCAVCGGTFAAAWSAEEAAAEREANFPGLEEAAADLVCDPCFKRLPVEEWRREWRNDPSIVVGVDPGAPGGDVSALRVVDIFGTLYAISPDFERQLRAPITIDPPLFDWKPEPDHFPLFGADRALPIIPDRTYTISGTLLNDHVEGDLVDRIVESLALVEVRIKYKGRAHVVPIPERWARVKGAAPHYRYWIRSARRRRELFGRARGRARRAFQSRGDTIKAKVRRWKDYGG